LIGQELRAFNLGLFVKGQRRMDRKLTEADARQSLRDHIFEKARNTHLKYGFLIDAGTMTRILDSRDVVRYPMGIRFDAGPLQAGEFAFLEPLGEDPSQGFCLFIHPRFQNRPEALPLIVAYYIPTVNYGEIASYEEAELFGATLLGMDVGEYYQALCDLADEIPKGPG
jgi:hypothetical protein